MSAPLQPKAPQRWGATVAAGSSGCSWEGVACHPRGQGEGATTVRSASPPPPHLAPRARSRRVLSWSPRCSSSRRARRRPAASSWGGRCAEAPAAHRAGRREPAGGSTRADAPARPPSASAPLRGARARKGPGRRPAPPGQDRRGPAAFSREACLWRELGRAGWGPQRVHPAVAVPGEAEAFQDLGEAAVSGRPAGPRAPRAARCSSSSRCRAVSCCAALTPADACSPPGSPGHAAFGASGASAPPLRAPTVPGSLAEPPGICSAGPGLPSGS